MSKPDTQYFPHDYNARSDSKIRRLMMRHGVAGVGIFWCIIEDLYNNANALPTDYDCIAYELHADSEVIASVVEDFGLFVIDGDTFSSSSVGRRLSVRNEKSNKARESAKKRWESADEMRTHSEGNAKKEIKVKESKEKEKKEPPHTPRGGAVGVEVVQPDFVEELTQEQIDQRTGAESELREKYDQLLEAYGQETGKHPGFRKFIEALRTHDFQKMLAGAAADREYCATNNRKRRNIGTWIEQEGWTENLETGTGGQLRRWDKKHWDSLSNDPAARGDYAKAMRDAGLLPLYTMYGDGRTVVERFVPASMAPHFDESEDGKLFITGILPIFKIKRKAKDNE